MAEQPNVRNEINGTLIGNVVQGRDITVSLPASVPVAVSGLPAQPVFVGRDAELAQLANVLDPATADTAGGFVVVSAVAGLAGVGKTALAVRAAHDAITAGWFPGGVLMVDLRGYDPPDRRIQPAAALASLLGALGTPSEHIPPDQADRERLWRSTLANRHAAGQRMLIVADNASSSEQVRPLLPATGRHRVIVTSRHSLADLDGARLLDIDVLPSDQATELLKQELAAARPGDSRVYVEPDAASQLGHLCGWLPLAIRIAAALLAAEPDQPIAELTEALIVEHHRLEELAYDGSLTVRAAFDLSYQHLTHEQARLFRLLSVNPGPEISTKAVAALLGCGVIDTRRLAGQLRRAHLLQPASATATSRGRWSMHDLLRVYAAEQAASDKEREVAFDRLLKYYLTTAQAANEHVDARFSTQRRAGGFATRQQALAWLDTELPNLVGAVSLAHATGRDAEVLALCDALHDFFELRQHCHDWIATQRLALAAARHLKSRSIEGLVLNRLGRAYQRMYRPEDAAPFHQQALEIFQDLADRLGQAEAWGNLGSTYRLAEQHDESTRNYQRALEMYRELGDRHGEARSLNSMSVPYDGQGDWENAANNHRRALEIFEELGDRDRQAGALGNLGNAYTQLRRWAEGAECHRLALDIWRELDDRHGQGGELYNVGFTYERMGRWDQAVDCYLQALLRYREFNDRRGHRGTLRRLSSVYTKLGQLDKAKYCQTQISDLFPDTDMVLDAVDWLEDWPPPTRGYWAGA
jgi:tetratricopeptide (TPR) repeat protein